MRVSKQFRGFPKVQRGKINPRGRGAKWLPLYPALKLILSSTKWVFQQLRTYIHPLTLLHLLVVRTKLVAERSQEAYKVKITASKPVMGHLSYAQQGDKLCFHTSLLLNLSNSSLYNWLICKQRISYQLLKTYTLVAYVVARLLQQ